MILCQNDFDVIVKGRDVTDEEEADKEEETEE